MKKVIKNIKSFCACILPGIKLLILIIGIEIIDFYDDYLCRT